MIFSQDEIERELMLLVDESLLYMGVREDGFVFWPTPKAIVIFSDWDEDDEPA